MTLSERASTRLVPDEALAELERCANHQFDPRLVEIFVRTMRQQPNRVIEVASIIARD